MVGNQEVTPSRQVVGDLLNWRNHIPITLTTQPLAGILSVNPDFVN